MSPPTENPCLKGLTPDCFAHNPQWAKRAFAYRLLHTITPKKLTRRLPKGLRLALIAPGVLVPPGIELPPGTTVPPGATIPPTWTAGDPAPPGITIPPGTSFPPGWTAGDPVPPDVIVDPGATFPPGWTPDDPIPAGSQPPPAAPPGTETTGPSPPLYTEPYSPGPPHPGIGPSPPAGYAWEVNFDNAHFQTEPHVSQPTWDGTKWTITTNGDCRLEPIGTWASGYRPTKIRMSLQPTSSTLMMLVITSTDYEEIANTMDYTHLQELDLTFGTGDLDWFDFGLNNNGINITNIEFYA